MVLLTAARIRVSGDRLALTVCGLRMQAVVTTGHAHSRGR